MMDFWACSSGDLFCCSPSSVTVPSCLSFCLCAVCESLILHWNENIPHFEDHLILSSLNITCELQNVLLCIQRRFANKGSLAHMWHVLNSQNDSGKHGGLRWLLQVSHRCLEHEITVQLSAKLFHEGLWHSLALNTIISIKENYLTK